MWFLFCLMPSSSTGPSSVARQFSMNCKSKQRLKYVQENQSDELLAELLYLDCAKTVPGQLILLFLLTPIRSSRGKGCLKG